MCNWKKWRTGDLCGIDSVQHVEFNEFSGDTAPASKWIRNVWFLEKGLETQKGMTHTVNLTKNLFFCQTSFINVESMRQIMKKRNNPSELIFSRQKIRSAKLILETNTTICANKYRGFSTSVHYSLCHIERLNISSKPYFKLNPNKCALIMWSETVAMV